MKKLLCLMGGAMLFICVRGQHVIIEPYNIGARVSEFPLTRLVNFNTDTASIASFGQKLIIIDFWGTHCGSCIKALPHENELQAEFKDEVQFIMVTSDDSAEVLSFLERYNAKNPRLTIPIVTSDILIQQMFKHSALPHFAWLGPDGLLLAQSTVSMLNREGIKATLYDIQKRKDDLGRGHFPENYFHFPKPNIAQEKFFQYYKY